MRATLTWIARRAAFLLLVVVIAGVFARQTALLDRQFIFFPERDIPLTPAVAGLEYRDVSFSASDGVELHGWFVPGESEATLLWFHGNAGNISHRVDNLAMLHHRLGVSVFIFDYRGYGRSEGAVSEKGIYLDAEAAIEYLGSHEGVVVDRQLVLFGRSLGCAVAVEMATRHQVRTVILESPFTSVRAMAKRHYPFLPAALLARLVQSSFDSLSKIADVHSPLMVFHGDADDIVPFAAGRQLFDAANEPKRFYSISGAGHNDTYMVGGEAYFEALKRFVENPEDEGE